MAYCTTDAVMAQLCGVDLGPLGDAAAQAAAIQAAVDAAGAEVDARCRRTFDPPGSAETREFDGGGLILRVPDLVRLDAVAVGGAAVAPAYAYPLDGPPFRWIATGGRFAAGRRNVAVTGLWGFSSAVPGDVSRAAACLAAAEMLGRLQAGRSGGAGSQSAGLAREEYPDGGPWGDRIAALCGTADRLLIPYRRWVV